MTGQPAAAPGAQPGPGGAPPFPGAPAPPPAALGGHWIAATLASRGITTVFTLPGGQVVPVLDGLRRAGVRPIDVHHESAAAQMAAGWTLATGRPGAALVTAGAGFTHAVSGLAEGVMGRLPVRLLAGRTDRGRQGRGAVQDIDQAAIAAAVGAVVSILPAEPGAAAAQLAATLDRAELAPPATHYIEVPGDTAWASGGPVTVPAGPRRRPPRALPAPSWLATAVAQLAGCRRPVCLVGSGAFWSGAGDALQRFMAATGIPVVTTSAARGLVPDGAELVLGGLIHGGLAMAMADGILVVGTRFNGNVLFGGPPLFPADAQVILVDPDRAAATAARPPDLHLVGDAAATLDGITGAWPGGARDPDWPARAKDAAAASRERWDQAVPGPGGGRAPLHPAHLALAVADAVAGRPATVVVDGGDILTWALPFLPAQRPGSLLTTSTTLGTVGVGLPYAIAAAAAHPDRPAVLLSGDGALGLAAMELATAVRHRLRLVVVVANNGGWGDVRQLQRLRLGPEGLVASSFGDLRFDRLATALGAFGHRVTSRAALDRGLRAALAGPGVTLLDVPTDPNAENWLMGAMGALGVL